jgi:uncharacterized protein (DUF169 family)
MNGLQTEPVGLTWEEKKECGVEEEKRRRGKEGRYFRTVEKARASEGVNAWWVVGDYSVLTPPAHTLASLRRSLARQD